MRFVLSSKMSTNGCRSAEAAELGNNSTAATSDLISITTNTTRHQRHRSEIVGIEDITVSSRNNPPSPSAVGPNMAAATLPVALGSLTDSRGRSNDRENSFMDSWIRPLRTLWIPVLFAVSFVRYDLVSMLYLLVFILHLLSYGFPSSHQFQGALVRLLAIFSGAVCLAKIVFYAVTVPSDDDSSNDSTAAQLFGFLPISSVLRGFLLVSPDVVVLLLSAMLWRSRAFRPPSPADDLLIEQDSSVVQIARRRRTHRRDMIICAFVVSIIFICLCTAMSAVPSLLVIPYQIFLCVELFAWSSSTKLLDKPLLAIRQMLVVYLVFDIVMIYLAQIPAIYSGIGQATAAKIGVFSLWGSADMNWRAVLQAVMIMLTFLLIAFHSYLARRHDRNPAQHLVAFAKGYQLDQLRHISIFRQTGRLVPRFTKFLNHNSSKLCALTGISSSITFPSYLTLPLMIWSSMILITPVSFFQRTNTAFLWYLEFVVCIQYIYNLSGFDPSNIPNVQNGLKMQDSFAGLALQNFLIFLFAISSFPWLHHQHSHQTSNGGAGAIRAATNQSVHSRSSSRRLLTANAAGVGTAGANDGNQANLSRRQSANSFTSRSIESTHRWVKLRNFLDFMWTYSIRLMLQYAYLISLIVIYVCGLQQVNVINAFFFFYFVIFLIFPKLAKVGWITLVIYTEVIIIMQFIWQLPFITDIAISTGKTWGFFISSDLWTLLRFHLVILIFTVIQQNTYEIINRKEKQRRYNQNNAENMTITTAPLEFGLQSFRIFQISKKLYLVGRYMARKLNIVACYLIFSLIGFLGTVTLFKLGYLTIIFANFILHQLHLNKTIQRLWILACLYPALVASMCYVYQFQDLQAILQGAFGQSLLQDIGLEQKSGSDLFEYLLQHVVALFFCVWQYRIFHAKISLEAEFESVKSNIPQWMFDLLEFLKRLTVMHVSKLAQILFFFTAISEISMIGFVSLVYLLIIMPFPQIQKSFRFILLLWVEFIICSRLLFQLQLVQNAVISREIWAYIGFSVYPTSYSPAYYLIGTVFLVYIIELQSLSKSWKQAAYVAHEDFPSDETEWPLWLFGLERDSAVLTPVSPVIEPIGPMNSPVSPEITEFNPAFASLGHGHGGLTTGSKRNLTLSRISQMAKISFHELATGLNFWLSNFFTKFGLEVCLVMHAIVALARGDAVGIVYLLVGGLWMAIPDRLLGRYWGLELMLIGISIAFQYLSAAGPPPQSDIQLPWMQLPNHVRQAIGYSSDAKRLYISPDFFLIFFCSLYSAVLSKRNSLAQKFRPWINYELAMNRDFTIKPRSFSNQMKFNFLRYFVWVPVLMSFVEGTVAVSLLGFVYLAFALYYMGVGESILLNRRTRLRVWQYISWYCYVWFALVTAYQIASYFFPAGSDFDQRGWVILIGFKSLPGGVSGLVRSANLVALFVFFSLLIQCRISSCSSIRFIVRYIRKDAAKALDRAKLYKEKRRRDVRLMKDRYDQEIKMIRDKVIVRKNYQKDVEDWVNLFGRRQDQYGYAIVDKTAQEDWDVVQIDNDDGFHALNPVTAINPLNPVTAVNHKDRLAPPFFTAVSSSSSDATPNAVHTDGQTIQHAELQARPSEQILQGIMNNDAQRFETTTAESSPQDTVPAEKVLRRVSWWERTIDKLISLIFRAASDYIDLYASERQIKKIQEGKGTRWWLLLRGLVFAISANTALIAFIAIYANQVYHGTLLSTVPTLAMLLVGVCQRPHPSKNFWQFIIFWIEFTIILKYFFDFNIFSFNSNCESEPIPGDLSVVLGIDKSCGNLFVDLITELIVLICCVVHRGMMRRVGLWKFFREVDDVDNLAIEEAEGGTPMIKVSTESVDRQDDSSLIGYAVKQNPDSVKTKPQICKKSQTVPGKSSSSDKNIRETPSLGDLVIEWEAERENKENVAIRRWNSFISRAKHFLDTSHLPGYDYYVAIFVSDFTVFILTLIFWSSFSGDSSSNFQFLYAVFAQNSVPPLFVAILLVNFCLIIGDRMIYISKSLIAKLVIQWITVIAFTMWIFFVLPPTNKELITYMPSLQLWYFVKCVYWYFSGLQIKSGYPSLRIYNFLMRNYGRLNNYLFTLYRAIPFVWEMRALIDWSLSETSLTFYSWLKFEDILAAIYQVKCDREDDGKDDKRRRFGERQDWRWKYAKGFLMILGLILILWFPLLLLALPGTTKINPADSMDISVQLTGFSPLYSQSVTRTLLQNFTRDQFEQLRSDNPGLIISYYQPENLQLATFQPSSMTDWPISPPAKTYLMSLLSNMAIELSIFFTWTIYKSNSGVSTTLRGQQLTVLSIENRVQFIQALNTTGSSQADILIKGLYPRFLHAYPDGTVTNLAPSSTPRLVDSILRYHQIASGNNTNGVAASAWWELLDYSDTGTTTSDTVNVTSASTEDRVNPNIYLLSDNVPTIATISSYGVLGLYIAVVFALGRFIRSAISDLTLRIVYEDLPNPDPVLQICSETLLAREFGDFETEETLYWQLITLFRSPQSLMEKTRLNKQD